MHYSTLFVNISNASILNNPITFNNVCNYTIIAHRGLFYLFKLSNAK